jgi:DNA-binding MarR family transcriptional regulator
MNRISTEKKLIELGYGNKVIKEHKRIRTISTTEQMNEIVKNLRNNNKVKYKESFIKKLGKKIPQTQAPKMK